MTLRRMISLALLLVFIGVSITGLTIHSSSHTGKDAAAAPGGWDAATLAGDAHLRRGHELAGYVFIVLGLLHLAVNRRAMLAHSGLGGKGGPGR